MSLSSVGSIPPINNTYPTTTDSVLVNTNNDNITSNNNNITNNTTEGTTLLAKTENGGEQNEFAVAETSNENTQSNPGIVYVNKRNRVLYFRVFYISNNNNNNNIYS